VRAAGVTSERDIPAKGGTPTAGVQDVCRTVPMDMVVAKDTDSAWSDRASWVWNTPPVYANSHVRVFSCGAGFQPAVPRFIGAFFRDTSR